MASVKVNAREWGLLVALCTGTPIPPDTKFGDATELEGQGFVEQTTVEDGGGFIVGATPKGRAYYAGVLATQEEKAEKKAAKGQAA